MNQRATTFAVVTVQVRVTLTQGWGDDCTMGQVRKQAMEGAKGAIERAVAGHPNIRIEAVDALTLTAREVAR